MHLAPTFDQRQQLVVRGNALPLASFSAWLGRIFRQPEVSGLVTIDSSALWASRANADRVPGAGALGRAELNHGGAGLALPAGMTSAGRMVVEGLDFSTAAFSGDRIRLARVEVPWQFRADGSTLVVEELAVRSELGELTSKGRVDVQEIVGARSAAAIGGQDMQVQGKLDLARLAAMLPQALRIRDETTITSGQIDMNVRSRPSGGGQRIHGTLVTAELAATNRGQPLRWDKPIHVSFDTLRQAELLRVNSLEVDSDFCRITAKGDDRRLQADARFDLDELARQLGQFVDLSQWRPAGTGTAELNWTKTADHRFKTDGTFHLQHFSLETGGQNVWSEPQLTISARGGGALDQTSGRPVRVDAARVELRAEGDTLDAELKSAVDLYSPNRQWPITVRAAGSVPRWLDRARPWINLDNWKTAGTLDLAANARAGPGLLELADLVVKLNDLRADGPAWQIDEPRVELTGDFQWDDSRGQVRSTKLQFVTSTISMLSRDVLLTMPQEGLPRVLGAVALRADLERLASLRRDPGMPFAWRPAGMFTGNVQFNSEPRGGSAELQLQGENLSLAKPEHAPAGEADSGQNVTYRTVWQEPQLSVAGRAAYEESADRLTLDQFRITSNTLQLTTSGSVERLATSRDLNFRGVLHYDLAQLTPLLEPYLGPDIRFEGKEQARIEITGSLADLPLADRSSGVLTSAHPSASNGHWSRNLQAAVEAPWGGANLFGLPVGAGKLVGQLNEGAVRLEPLSFSVGQGRLSARPHVQLDPPPAELTLPSEQVITNVRISPEVSDAMLKYIAPVLADATRTDGVFTMRLDGARVPLDNPRQADVAGKLEIHSVDVMPGRATEKWVRLAQQIESLIRLRDPRALTTQPPKTLLKARERTVPFRLVDGRVYHEGMEFTVGDVVVRSRGSVGLDETLSMTLDVPILDKWVQDAPLLSGFRGQSLQIPVAGTLSGPVVDPQAVSSLSAQLLRGAAEESLGGELRGVFDKLFGRPPAPQQ